MVLMEDYSDAGLTAVAAAAVAFVFELSERHDAPSIDKLDLSIFWDIPISTRDIHISFFYFYTERTVLLKYLKI